MEIDIEFIKEWCQRLVTADPIRFCYKEDCEGNWTIIDHNPKHTKMYSSTWEQNELWGFIGPLFQEFVRECKLDLNERDHLETMLVEIVWTLW